MRVLCLKAEPKHLERLAECAYRLTPQVSLRKGEFVFLEISQCFHLWSEAVMLARLDSVARRLKISFQLGLGETPGEALARVNHREIKVGPASSRLSIDALLDFFDPFRVHSDCEESLKKISRMISIFRGLGIEYLEDWAEIPVNESVSRFGYEAAKLHQMIREAARMPWPKFVPVEQIEETVVIDGFCEGESFLFFLKQACDAVFLRLSARGERAESFEVEIRQRKAVRKILIDFWSPQGGTLSALGVMREKLAREWDREPLRDEVNEVILRVVRTSPSRAFQRDFFSKKDEDHESFQDLVGRLSDTLGEGKVFFAQPLDRYRPEAAWEGQISFEIASGSSAVPSKSNGGAVERFVESRPPRPTRVLKEPLPISFMGLQDHALSSKQWMHCQKMNRRWRIRSFDGPERLQGEWWSENGFQRDYFRVMTESGESLWIYQSQAKKFFLHGFFD